MAGPKNFRSARAGGARSELLGILKREVRELRKLLKRIVDESKAHPDPLSNELSVIQCYDMPPELYREAAAAAKGGT